MAVFDLHCDTITEAYKHGLNIIDNELHFSLKKLPQGQCWNQCFAIWMPDELRGDRAVEYFEENYNYFLSQMIKYSPYISQAYSLDDILYLNRCGKNSALLTVEGGSVLCGNMDRVKYIRGLGVRMLTLTWNGQNELGGGQLAHNGLSEFGREAVAEMEKQGIIVDLSHLNDQTFKNVIDIIKRPPVASHSNSREVFPHKRNLTDRQFLEIVKRGGIVGINLYKNFIDGKNPDADRLLNHIKHFINLGGAEHIALGSDFDGADIPEYTDSPVKLANLRLYMLQSGLSKLQVDNLYHNNALNFFARYGL